jgi:hypothetical protein
MKFDYTWIMSGITIFTMWLAGDKKKLAWILGLLNQVLWLYFIYDKQSWGLLPMTFAMVFIYARNLYKWSK